MKGRNQLIAAFLVGWLGLVASALGEERFPPPDFEEGHVLPITTTPPPRLAALEHLDVVVLALGLALAACLVLRKRSRRAIAGLSVFSLAYFGFYKGGCVCAIGSFQNVALALSNHGYSPPLFVVAIFFLPIIFTLFAGRVFCAAVCPHGAIQDLVLLKPVKVPLWLEHGLGLIPYVCLGAGVLFAVTGSTFLICRYDPFVPLFRLSGSVTMILAGVGFLLVGMFVGRPYCRFLCPYGALLRLAALVSKWRVRVTPDFCTQCRLCEESCPHGAMREPVQGSPNPEGLAADRRRLFLMLLALPVLVLAGAWTGSKLQVPGSRLHAKVALAETFADPKRPAVEPGNQTPENLMLGRAEREARQLLPQAAAIRRQFLLGGALLGGWVGLVVGVKLIGLSLRPSRTDFEPDRGACYACGRCFLYCPNERVRLGLMPASALPQGPPFLPSQSNRSSA